MVKITRNPVRSIYQVHLYLDKPGSAIELALIVKIEDHCAFLRALQSKGVLPHPDETGDRQNYNFQE